jgi:ureidoglycolate dehydrogenase (NAD+)
MAEYIVNHRTLTELVKKIVVHYGAAESDAEQLASMMVKANLRGIDSHGVMRVPNYIDRLKAGGMKPRFQVRVERETETTALVDGDHGFGAVACNFAAELARKKAKEHGLGMVTLKNSEHTGALSLWSLLIAQDDMIGFVGTAMEPLMAPTGGKNALLGNNPFSFVVPAGKYEPICLDMASSLVAAGKVIAKKMAGEPIPMGWALDENGISTTDPSKFKLLQPVGEHKGYGLSVVVECLSSLLSGGAFGPGHGKQYGDLANPNSVNSFFVAVDISHFRRLEDFAADAEKFVEYVHSCEKAPGTERIYYPGEIEGEHTAKTLANGIKLDENLVAQLEKYALDAGVTKGETTFLREKPFVSA